MSWFKLMGTALIIAGFGTWGLSGAKAVEKRTWELKEFIFAIAFLEKGNYLYADSAEQSHGKNGFDVPGTPSPDSFRQ